MKKSFIFLLTIFFSIFLFAEQPFFIDKWIVPEDLQWGSRDRVPERPGLYQTKEAEKGFDYIHVLPSIEMPPYFTENNLIDWKKPYSEILTALKKDKKFSVYEEPNYRLINSDARVGYKLIAIPREYPEYKITITFAYCKKESDRNTCVPTSFQVHFFQVAGWPLAPSEVFETKYRKDWELLSDLEKYAVAFSSNLFEINHAIHLDFTNKARYLQGKRILKDSWNITDYKSLVDNFNDLEESGHSGAYDKLLALLNKHKGKSVLEIAHAEKLDVIQTTRLYYVDKMKDVLGQHGIEAWDEGREITTIRWGLGAGYISYDEAISLIEPVVERIKNNYVSWDDFMAHYMAGRGFFALYSSDYKSMVENAIKAAEDSRKSIPYQEIIFSGTNADKKHEMTFIQSFYNPDADALKWEEVQKLYNKKPDVQVLASLEELEAGFPECKGITFYWHLSLLRQFSDSKNVVAYIELNENYWSALPQNNDISINTKYFYICALNGINQPRKALEVFEALPDEVKKNPYVYYQYACSYYILSMLTPVESEKTIYQSRAVNAFLQCEKLGIELNEFIRNWIDSLTTS